MNLVALADLHGRLPDMARIRPSLTEADVVLLTGDVTHLGLRRETLEMVQPLRSVKPNLLAVTGNCDPAGVADVLRELGCLLEGEPVEQQGVWFAGLGGSLPGPVPTPHELSEDELDAALTAAMAKVPDGAAVVLVCHQPPADTACDRITSGAHVGSRSVRACIEKRQPLICFTGHIHESRAIDRIGASLIVNPGPLGGGWLAKASIVDGEVRACDLARL